MESSSERGPAVKVRLHKQEDTARLSYHAVSQVLQLPGEPSWEVNSEACRMICVCYHGSSGL